MSSRNHRPLPLFAFFVQKEGADSKRPVHEKDETFKVAFEYLLRVPSQKKKKKKKVDLKKKKKEDEYYSYDDDGDGGTDQNAFVSFSLFYLLSNFQMTAKRTRRKKKEEIEKKKKQTTTNDDDGDDDAFKRKTRKAGLLCRRRL